MFNSYEVRRAILCVIATLAAAGAPALATTYTVINTNDSGAGSLRQAILDATSDINSDTIAFNIPGGGVKTISPVTTLPNIPASTKIDGFTQPGASPNSLPNGSNAVHLIVISGPGGGGDGLRLGSGVTLSGLVINGFTGGYGVHALNGGSGILVEGCHIGTDAAGTVAVPNGGGIWLEATITFEIGLNFNIFTTLAPEGARNVISGNNGDGIRITGTTFNTTKIIQGNHIGVDSTGLVELGNNGDGVEIFNSATIQFGNTSTILPGLHDSNIIGGNAAAGILITGASSTFNGIVAANIGTDMTGTVNLGNSGAGVLIDGGASDNSLGFGGPVNARSRVAFNTGPGVLVNGASSLRNTIRVPVYGNTGLNIDLGNDGVTGNDACDGDAGPNALINKPVITGVVQLAPTDPIQVQGSLDLVAGNQYIIDFYTSSSCNPANPAAFRYAQTVNYNPAVCSTNFNFALTQFTADRQQGDDYIVAITYESFPGAGNTSEISNCYALPPFTSPGVDLKLVKTAAPDPATEGVPLVYTLEVTNNGQTTANSVTVSDPLPPGTTFLIGDGSCTFSSGTQTVNCNYGTIGGNGSIVSHQFSVVPTGPGTVSNTATASSSVTDDKPADNIDTAVTPVSMAVYDFEATTTGGGFACPPNVKKQICTLGDLLSLKNNGSEYFHGELNLTSTCKKITTPSISCKIKGTLEVGLFNVLGVANHDITAYLSTDTTVDAGDVALATAPSTLLAALAPKGKSVKIKYSHPKGQSYTGQYILLKLDSGDAVGETDELNNVLVIGVFP